MLEKEFEYFKSHHEELVAKYSGKYLVIVGEEVVGVYDSEIEAYSGAQQKYPLGTFLLQPCTPGKEGYTQTFHSRVSV